MASVFRDVRGQLDRLGLRESPAASSGTVCVRCEIVAWRWVQMNVQPSWTLEMHEQLVDALQTYSQYATETERAEIQKMCSSIGFRRVQLERAKV